ncbi:MAG: glycogen debranching protein GlgX [Chloroflexi bacterium]|nr:glycogen debranching protein GlgX [Chloroflexota bacterium]
MDRIDLYPTHEHGSFRLRRGRPFPLGVTMMPGKAVNFSVYSANATACTLVLFEPGARTPYAEIPFPEEFRTGDVFAMMVFDLDPEDLEYGFKMDGPWAPHKGQRFDPDIVLLDPYARLVVGRDVWGKEPDAYDPYPMRSRILRDDFDWEDDRPPKVPIEDLVIYEMHVRGFTQHASSNVKHPGTYAGIREKIPYFKELGINCIELMPVTEFDEFEYPRYNPVTGERLLNYWGYSPVAFFAVKAGYAATGYLGMQSDEFKALVKELHANDIEVFLDMVYNHTNEGNENGPTTSFRGLDNATYYMLDQNGYYKNYSGTGNTLNCNHPVVREMIIDSLRYWVSEYHIDGFRFDLASIMGRDQDGTPLKNPPLIEALAFDPLLKHTKLIAEAWDAGGLYQVGTFPSYGRWAEWNGKYRSIMRRWVRGDFGVIGEVAQRLVGSPDLYGERGPTASINFITAHDGFTLRDLFSYNDKHNEANGEGNRDGGNDNDSWNCGVEGETDDPEINDLRVRMMKNAMTLLFVSHGVPMIRMGDEYGHTSLGNNNTYCQDNELSWFNWSLIEHNQEIWHFFRKLIAIRMTYPILRHSDMLTSYQFVGTDCPFISWHGADAWHVDWEGWNRSLGLMLCGREQSTARLNKIYIAMNMHDEPLSMDLPENRFTRRWHLMINTGVRGPGDAMEIGQEHLLTDQAHIHLEPRSIVVLVAK